MIRVPLSPFCCKCLTPLAALAALAHSAHAAIVGTGDGTQNTTVPTRDDGVPDTPAFNNVASYRVGSAVYLGNRWLLTAEHVHGGIDVGPVRFSNAPGAPAYDQEGVGIQLSYTGPGGGPTDLTLIRIAADPGLPQLYFAPTPTEGTSIVFAGFGRNRQTNLTRWNTNTDPWTRVPNGGNAAGYEYADGTAKRWVTNVIEALTDSGSVTIEHDNKSYLGKITLIGADFSRSGGTTSEGIAAPGDSGGGAFVNNRLVGIPLYLGTFDGQPENAAVFGNLTYFANTASYVDQIASITGLHPSESGDANLDGLVNDADFDLLRQHFGQSAGWTGGDFTLDGVVNFADFQVLELNFPGTIPTEMSEMLRGLSSVPEPASIGFLIGGIGIWGLKRGRRYCNAERRVWASSNSGSSASAL
jgi:hypothetical protein